MKTIDELYEAGQITDWLDVADRNRLLFEVLLLIAAKLESIDGRLKYET